MALYYQPFPFYLIGSVLIVACRFFPILVGIDFPVGRELRNISNSLDHDTIKSIAWFGDIIPFCSDAVSTLVIFLNVDIFGELVSLYDMQGRMLEQTTAADNKTMFAAPVRGVYLLRVGMRAAHKIVIAK